MNAMEKLEKMANDMGMLTSGNGNYLDIGFREEWFRVRWRSIRGSGGLAELFFEDLLTRVPDKLRAMLDEANGVSHT